MRSVAQIGLRLNLVITLCVMISVQLLAEPILLLFDPAHTAVTLEGIRNLRRCCGNLCKPSALAAQTSADLRLLFPQQTLDI